MKSIVCVALLMMASSKAHPVYDYNTPMVGEASQQVPTVVRAPKPRKEQYWWAGPSNPFEKHGSLDINAQAYKGGSSASSSSHIGVGQPRLPPSSGGVAPQVKSAPPTTLAPTLTTMMAMGVCPSSFICIQWQLCRNGKVIIDGSGIIDKSITQIPSYVRNE